MQELTIEKRQEICHSCPIYDPIRKLCNPKLWLNPNTNEVSSSAKAGFIRGCGCMIDHKLRGLNNHCIAGKW